MRVGFIGLGTMGGNAAKNIIRAGFETSVHDLRPEAAEDHIAMGASWAESPREMIERVDCIVSMVFGPAQCEAILKHAGGLLEGDCNGKLWIDLTTSSPAFMRELVQEFVLRGGKPIDAPVTGSGDAAIRRAQPRFGGGAESRLGAARRGLEAQRQVREVGIAGYGY